MGLARWFLRVDAWQSFHQFETKRNKDSCSEIFIKLHIFSLKTCLFWNYIFSVFWGWRCLVWCEMVLRLDGCVFLKYLYEVKIRQCRVWAWRDVLPVLGICTWGTGDPVDPLVAWSVSARWAAEDDRACPEGQRRDELRWLGSRALSLCAAVLVQFADSQPPWLWGSFLRGRGTQRLRAGAVVHKQPHSHDSQTHVPESAAELYENPAAQVAPLGVKSECLGVGARHQVFCCLNPQVFPVPSKSWESLPLSWLGRGSVVCVLPREKLLCQRQTLYCYLQSFGGVAVTPLVLRTIIKNCEWPPSAGTQDTKGLKASLLGKQMMPVPWTPRKMEVVMRLCWFDASSWFSFFFF